MSDNKNDYGLLLNKDIKLHRTWFKQMAKLLGINCLYRAPLPGPNYDKNGDLDTGYHEPIVVPCILDRHPDQKSLKKMGWMTELQTDSLMLHVPYDLPHLASGALFTLPSGIDGAPGRTFRVLRMQNIMIYPASIACEIAPEYKGTDEKTMTKDFEQAGFTALIDNEEDD